MDGLTRDAIVRIESREVVTRHSPVATAPEVAIHAPHLSDVTLVEVHDVERGVTVVERPRHQALPADCQGTMRVVVASIKTATAVIQFNSREILVEDVVLDLGAAVRAILVIAVKVEPAIVAPRTTIVDVGIAQFQVSVPTMIK